MNKQHRLALRAATRVQQWLREGRVQEAGLMHQDQLQSLGRLNRQLSEAMGRGWTFAAARLRETLLRELREMQNLTALTISSLTDVLDQRPLPCVAEIWREILALHEEFEEVEFRGSESTLRVTTARVVLDGTDLGPFQICLDLSAVDCRPQYRLIALDPNPASADEDTTHPHVRDGCLCEGQGQAAIKASLHEGRIADFFLIVSRLLATYAEGSAFIELDNWHGAACGDCGYHMSRDDSYSCDACGGAICDDCRRSCERCSDGYCSSCIQECRICGTEHCSECLDLCSACHIHVCPDCQLENACRRCHDQEESDFEEGDDGHRPTAETVGLSAPLQPDSLGQTALPA